MLSLLKNFKNKIINCAFVSSIVVCLIFHESAAAVEPDALLGGDMSELFMKRYSGYRYDPSRKVTREQLREIVEAGRSAPSSYNEQPWNFIICDRDKDREGYEKALDALMELNRIWAQHAPILIIAIASTQSSYKEESNRWAQYDTGAAAFAMTLRATSMGLMAHQMGGFNVSKIQQEFFIPDDCLPMSVIAIGYQTVDEARPEKKRKAVGENFFVGSWGNKFQ